MLEDGGPEQGISGASATGSRRKELKKAKRRFLHRRHGCAKTAHPRKGIKLHVNGAGQGQDAINGEPFLGGMTGHKNTVTRTKMSV